MRFILFERRNKRESRMLLRARAILDSITYATEEVGKPLQRNVQRNV